MTRSSWVVGAALLLASGCSFGLSGPDPKQPRGQEPKCDTEKTAVLADGLLATAAGVTTLAVGANSGGAAILPAVIGVVLAGAAIHGNTVVNECRGAKAEYVASLQETPAPAVSSIRLPASTPATFAGAGPNGATTPPPDPDPTPAPAPAAAPTPPVAPAPAPTWSAFWKEVH